MNLKQNTKQEKKKETRDFRPKTSIEVLDIQAQKLLQQKATERIMQKIK